MAVFGITGVAALAYGSTHSEQSVKWVFVAGILTQERRGTRPLLLGRVVHGLEKIGTRRAHAPALRGRTDMAFVGGLEAARADRD